MVLWVLSADTHYGISGFVYRIDVMTFSREYGCCIYSHDQAGGKPPGQSLSLIVELPSVNRV